MRLATEPGIVKLPASVAVRGSGSAATNGFSTSMAGTLLARLERTAATAAMTAGSARLSRPAAASASRPSTAFSMPATTMNNPANMSSSDQSISIDALGLDAPRHQQQRAADDGDLGGRLT